MITINITDLANEDQNVLRKLASCLLSVADMTKLNLSEDLPKMVADINSFAERHEKNATEKRAKFYQKIAGEINAVNCPACGLAFPEDYDAGRVPPHECTEEQEKRMASWLVVQPETEETAADAFGTPAPSSVAEPQITRAPESLLIGLPEHLHPMVNGNLDSAGQEWDSRIHSRTQSKNKDGTWKVQRGKSPYVITKVTGTKAVVLPDLPAPPVVAVPPAPPVAPAPQAPAAAPAPSAISFQSVLARLSKAVSGKRIAKEEIVGYLMQADPSLTSMEVFAQHREFVPAVSAVLDRAGL